MLLMVLSFRTPASLTDACWTDPFTVIEFTIDSLQGGIYPGSVNKLLADYNPWEIPALCNRKANYSDADRSMYETELSPALMPTAKPDFYYLTDTLDVRFSGYNNQGSGSVPYPVTFSKQRVIFTEKPVPKGENVPALFHVWGTATPNIDLLIKKVPIGGAIIIPANIELYTLWAVAFGADPIPARPDRPLFKVITGFSSVIIPIPVVCDINNGTPINIEFGNIMVSEITASPLDTLNGKSVNINIKCSSSLNQDVALKYVADPSPFSGDLIATNNPNLGIAIVHRGKVVKPLENSPAIRLVNGQATESIIVTPVKKAGARLDAGEFNASATLIVTAL